MSPNLPTSAPRSRTSQAVTLALTLTLMSQKWAKTQGHEVRCVIFIAQILICLQLREDLPLAKKLLDS